MQTVLLKVQQDILARRQPTGGLLPRLRNIAGVAILCAFAFSAGARSGPAEASWGPVEADRGEAALQQAYIERLEQVQRHSSHYGIGADLAGAIEDIARAEGIEPSVAFGLVRTESEFTQRAVSPVGAVGYTQLMPETARLLSPGLPRDQMFERDTNLRLGFRFLHFLVAHYDGDLRLALLAYNRGPATVDRLLAGGADPDNGYAERVLAP